MEVTDLLPAELEEYQSFIETVEEMTELFDAIHNEGSEVTGVAADNQLTIGDFDCLLSKATNATNCDILIDDSSIINIRDNRIVGCSDELREICKL